MTDREKLEAIKAEIERRMDILYPQLPDASKVVHENISIEQAGDTGKYVALESLLTFINSLPEEPVRSVWHDLSEEPEPDAKIVTLYEGQLITTTRKKYIRGVGKFDPEKWAYMEDLLDKKEEPVSEDLEKAATTYTQDWFCQCPEECENAFKAGAKWDRQRIIDKACEWILDIENGLYIMQPNVMDNFRKALEEE